jgi:hypothetical protein
MSADELVLFDALFDKWLPPSALESHGFAERLGLKSGHQLTPPELDETLERLRERRLIKVRRSARVVLTLSARGGALWEAARRPQWGLYCEDLQTEIGGRWTLRVRAVDKGTAEAFIDAAAQSGLYTFAQGSPPIRWKRSRMMLTPWQRAECLSTELALTANASPIDWAAYERGRRWWRTVDELQTLPSAVDE